MQAITVQLFVVCALVGVCCAGLPTKNCGSNTDREYVRTYVLLLCGKH